MTSAADGEGAAVGARGDRQQVPSPTPGYGGTGRDVDASEGALVAARDERPTGQSRYGLKNRSRFDGAHGGRAADNGLDAHPLGPRAATPDEDDPHAIHERTAQVGVVLGQTPRLGLAILGEGDDRSSVAVKKQGRIGKQLDARENAVVEPRRLGNERPRRTKPSVDAECAQRKGPSTVGSDDRSPEI